MAAEARVRSEEAVGRFGDVTERFGGVTERFGGVTERFGGVTERFGGGSGLALLPWTKHMLLVLWDQLRLLVQIIYYTFVSVFQMFRFEVHVRITDDPSVTPDPSDPFLFSSLFSEDAAADHTEALLSSLRGEDGEGGLFMRHKHPSSSSWAVRDWNIFVSSSEARCSDEERSGASCWSSEEEHSLEFDCDESKALWESLSRSNDPYDPFCFSACISTCSSKALWETQSSPGPAPNQSALWETRSKPSQSEDEGGVCPSVCASCDQKTDRKGLWETESSSSDSPEMVLDWSEGSWECDASESRVPPAGRFWESSSAECSDAEDCGTTQRRSLVRRSDSDSSWSSENSESGSETSERREENQLLWDLFAKSSDPFNPLCFSATSRRAEEERHTEDELWSAVSKEQDPYHPLNFSASRRNQRSEEEPRSAREDPTRRRRRGEKPELTHRNPPKHHHPQVTLRPWTRAGALVPLSALGPERHKKVRFSDQVQVHVMRSWLFARQASRRGPWEESARDRERFKRRVLEAERTVGPCLSPEHRDRVRARTQDQRSGARTQDQRSGARTQDQRSGARTQDQRSGARTQDQRSGARTQDQRSGARTQD